MSLQSLRTGVSGLLANQTRLNVISNNISNSSTVAFKKGRAAFSEVLGQEIVGVNQGAGSKVGRGVSVASVDRNFSQGSLDQTGIKTDLALSGDGFFVASPKADANSQQRRLTRAGDFTFNQDGELVTNGGLNVQGWTVNEEGKARTGQLTNIKIDPNAQSDPKFSSEATIGGNLAANASVGTETSISTVVYDEQGTPHDVVVDFEKVGADRWNYSVESAGSKPFNLTATEQYVDGSGNPITDSDGDIITTASADSPPEGAKGTKRVKKGFLDADGRIIRKDTDGDGTVEKVKDAKNLDDTDNARSIDPTTTLAYKDTSTGKFVTNGGSIRTVESATEKPTPDPPSGGNIKVVEIDKGYLNGDNQIITDASGDIVTEAKNVPSGARSSAESISSIGNLTFGTGGSVKKITDESGNKLDSGPSIDWKNSFVNGGGPDDQATGDNQLNLDLTEITQFSGSTTAKFQSQNGNTSGELAGFSFTQEGKLQLNYTNGKQEQTYQLAIGNVNNPNGLEQQGENFYTTTSASGDLQLGRAGRDLQTSVVSGSLESSNVDLAQEFADLIEAQRSYQASARVITTADQILQETVQLKR